MKSVISTIVFAFATTAVAQQQQPSVADSANFVTLLCTAKAKIEANVPSSEVANVLQVKDQAISFYTAEAVGLVEAATEVAKKGLEEIQKPEGNSAFLDGYTVCEDISAVVAPLVYMATELGGRCVDNQGADVDFSAIIAACTAFSEEVAKLREATTQP
jgi:hypothetical protein